MLHRTHEKRRDSGLCLHCESKRSEGKAGLICATCRGKENERQKARRRSRKANRLCPDCGVALEEGESILCQSCSVQRRNYKARRRAELKQQGICVCCGAEPIITTGVQSLGKRCFLRQRSQRHLGKAQYWTVLAEIWEQQQGICPYTRLPLRLGIDASLDHIRPSGRFPEQSRDPNNLQWVHSRINVMKGDWTPEEFLAFITRIVAVARRASKRPARAASFAR